jgi:hypothetical protein
MDIFVSKERLKSVVAISHPLELGVEFCSLKIQP